MKRISNETVKALLKALQKAYKSGDSRLVKRISVLLDQPTAIAAKHGIAVSSIYGWLKV